MALPAPDHGIVTAFLTALKELDCTVLTVRSDEDAVAAITAALKARGVAETVAWSDAALAGLDLAGAAGAAGIAWHAANPEADASLYREAAARAGAGVTGAAWAVAETGTLALLSGPGRPRSASLLPPVHIALVWAHQIVATTADLFRELVRLSAENTVPTSLSLITGASRTADIEHVLVRKVHGPGEVVVVLIDQAQRA